jgi:hypothetical protein
MRVEVTFWMVTGPNGLGLLALWLDGSACMALAVLYGLVLLNGALALLSTLVVILGLAAPAHAPRGSTMSRLLAGWLVPLGAAMVVAVVVPSGRWTGSCSSVATPLPAVAWGHHGELQGPPQHMHARRASHSHAAVSREVSERHRPQQPGRQALELAVKACGRSLRAAGRQSHG